MASIVIAICSTVGGKCVSEEAKPLGQFVCTFPGCKRPPFTQKSHLKRHENVHLKDLSPPTAEIGWKQHFKYNHIYGLPDGRLWSTKLERYLEGTQLNGYCRLKIDGRTIARHRLNFEIAIGRAIADGMEVDHIVSPPSLPDGSTSEPQDDSWSNLQELTREDHMKKTKAANPDFGKKVGVRLGFPVVCVHVATGAEQRFDSIADAAAASG